MKTPSHPHPTSPLFLCLVSNPLCLSSCLSRILCASHVFVSSYLFLSLILILLLLHCYIVLHNGFSLALTSPSSSMSMLLSLNASRVLVSTLQTLCHSGYLVDLSQHDREFQEGVGVGVWGGLLIVTMLEHKKKASLCNWRMYDYQCLHWVWGLYYLRYFEIFLSISQIKI